MTTDQEPINPYAGLGWEELLSVIGEAERLAARTNETIQQARGEVNEELAPLLRQREEQELVARLARAALKPLAIQNWQANRRDIGKKFGGVGLQFRPKVIVLDIERAVMALDGLALLDPTTGEQTPLVTYQPVINEKAVRAYIEWARATGQVDDQTDGCVPAPNGWPGIVILTDELDERSWVLQVERLDAGKPPERKE